MECQNCHKEFPPRTRYSKHAKFCSKECKLAKREGPIHDNKVCNKCITLKPASEFYTRKNGYLSDTCKPCFLQRRKSYVAEFRKTKLPHRVATLKSVLNKFKSRPCMDCNKTFPPYVMDLDHRDQLSKIASTADLIRTCTSVESFQNELDKCDVVCSNCHRIRTFEQKLYSTHPPREHHRRTRSMLRIRRPKVHDFVEEAASVSAASEIIL